MAAPPDLRPAGFWQRSVAWSIDAALIAPLALLLAWPWLAAPAHAWAIQGRGLLRLTGRVMGDALATGGPPPPPPTAVLAAPGLGEAIAAVHAASWALAWPALLAFAVLGAVYHVAAECSPWQGGIGKRLLGLRACDRQGRRLSSGRAARRHLAATLSWATLNVGHLMAASPPRHRALHDRCSGTRVLAVNVALPGWAWMWVGLLALAGLVATGMLAGAAAEIMRVAIEQALY